MTAPGTDVIADNVAFALRHLDKLRRPSGLYCFDVAYGQNQLRGESVRYSLMVLLGLQRAAMAGITELPDDPDVLWDRCLERESTLTAGDLGLAIWADSRRDGADTARLLERLERLAGSEESLIPLAGMEIGWLIIGLAEAAATIPAVEGPLLRLVAHLRDNRRAPTGLYYHDGGSRIRRHLPNFATEIYSLMALAALARHGLDDAARADAEELATHLVRLQLADGSWPWLFDADRASVVERYEIYSVHQDAMAPMGLLALGDVTGETRWGQAAVRGLAWSRGSNELDVDLFDELSGFAHRSIRRRQPWDKLALWTASGTHRLLGRPVDLSAGGVEVDATCRPYHLGWILEAWAGRQDTDGEGDRCGPSWWPTPARTS